MFGRKAKYIAELERGLALERAGSTDIFQKLTASNTRLRAVEEERVGALAQVENLREQLTRALDEKQRVSNEHSALNQEMNKREAKIAELEEELRIERTAAQRTAGQAQTARITFDDAFNSAEEKPEKQWPE